MVTPGDISRPWSLPLRPGEAPQRLGPGPAGGGQVVGRAGRIEQLGTGTSI
jgi:hypothetical protein